MNNKEKTIEALLRYEAAVRAVEKLKEKHEAVFEQLAQLEADQSAIKTEIAQLVDSKSGPPAWMEVMGEKGRGAMLKGGRFRVRVTYSKAGDTYDPKTIPSSVLSQPGVIKALDPEAVRAAALRLGLPPLKTTPGAWKKPSVMVELSTAPIYGETELEEVLDRVERGQPLLPNGKKRATKQ